jgi:N-methylhydantoinase A
MAASFVAKQLGVSDLISFDMGGTTAKASVIIEGEVTVTAEYEVGGAGHSKRWMNGTGHPVRVPVVDLVEVSAGGGSISWIDPGGAMKVGPQSAGADPGPACYNRGGTLPTVTDANVVLGYLDPVALLGGALEVNFAAAHASIQSHLAEPQGLTVVEAAGRIIDVVNANMVEALRMVSVERGYDPREFSLMAFGGAGPVHATALASELEMIEVIVPPVPGAFSALGLVATDLRRDYSRTLYADLATIDPAQVQDAFAQMEKNGIAMLDDAKVPEQQRRFLRSVDVRYRRQAYELTVQFDGDREGVVTQDSLDGLATSFHRQHEQTYGHANADEPIQLVNVRLKAVGRLPSLQLKQKSSAKEARERTRSVWFAGTEITECRILWRTGLKVGEIIDGPAIVESLDSTVVVPPAWSASVENDGYIRIRKA